MKTTDRVQARFIVFRDGDHMQLLALEVETKPNFHAAERRSRENFSAPVLFFGDSGLGQEYLWREVEASNGFFRHRACAADHGFEGYGLPRRSEP